MPHDSISTTANYVNIAGGGDAGIFTTLFHLATDTVEQVHIYESADKKLGDATGLSALRSMASGIWLRQHSGGEYPTDMKTAIDLLHASIVMSKIMPEGIYNPIEGVQYLISAVAQNEGVRTVEKQREVMDALAAEYEKICSTGDDAKIFGSVEQFRRYLKPEEFSKYDGLFVGGVETSEKSINPVIAAKVLFDKLRHYIDEGKLIIHPNSTLTDIKRVEDGKFECVFSSCDGTKRKETLEGRFINCAGIGGLGIASKLEGVEAIRNAGIDGVKLYHRAMALVNVSEVPSDAKKAIFGMGAVGFNAREGEKTCGMFAALNDKFAYTYLPTTTGSYLPVADNGALFIRLTPEEANVPIEFLDKLYSFLPDETKRKEAIEKSLHDSYPGTSEARVVKLIHVPLVVVEKFDETMGSDDHHTLTQRTRKGEINFGDSGHNLMEKGTHAGINAVESVINTLIWQVQRGKLSIEQASEKLSIIYNGSLPEPEALKGRQIYLAPISPTLVKADALFTAQEKKQLNEQLKTPEYIKQCLQLASERFGEEVGSLMLGHLSGIKIQKDRSESPTSTAHDHESIIYKSCITRKHSDYEQSEEVITSLRSLDIDDKKESERWKLLIQKKGVRSAINTLLSSFESGKFPEFNIEITSSPNTKFRDMVAKGNSNNLRRTDSSDSLDSKISFMSATSGSSAIKVK